MEKFVKDFLRIGNLSPTQKDKMNELILKNIKQNTTIKDFNFIDPFGEKSLSKFLLAYNQDPLLKYTWHNIDKETITDDEKLLEVKDYIEKHSKSEKYSVENHQKLLEERYKELTKKYDINPQVYALLLAYLTGRDKDNNKNKKWSSNQIEINWASDELIQWSKDNPGYIPNANGELKKEQKGNIFKLGKELNSNLNGKKIKDFSELVIYCKNLFHIRRDNSLKNILEYVIEQQKWDKSSFSLNEINENIELFTDVDKLLQFFKEYINFIYNEISRDTQNHKFELSFGEDGEYEEYVNFIIHHINKEKPFYKKDSKSTISRYGTKYNSLINKINGICELWLEADFENEPSYKINLWTKGKWKEK